MTQPQTPYVDYQPAPFVFRAGQRVCAKPSETIGYVVDRLHGDGGNTYRVEHPNGNWYSYAEHELEATR